jgi:hypothetical protein
MSLGFGHKGVYEQDQMEIRAEEIIERGYDEFFGQKHAEAKQLKSRAENFLARVQSTDEVGRQLILEDALKFKNACSRLVAAEREIKRLNFAEYSQAFAEGLLVWQAEC